MLIHTAGSCVDLESETENDSRPLSPLYATANTRTASDPTSFEAVLAQVLLRAKYVPALTEDWFKAMIDRDDTRSLASEGLEFCETDLTSSVSILSFGQTIEKIELVVRNPSDKDSLKSPESNSEDAALPVDFCTSMSLMRNTKSY